VVIAGTHSGVGKTSVATGIMAALAARGLRVAPFKVGPDFIDPSYHRLAAGRPGRNLDPYLCGAELIEPLLLHGSSGADIAVIEGVMGLFDGVAATQGYASTAHVAKLLRAPVVLVVDASSLSTSVGALVHGFANYDRELAVRGVILNRVGSAVHEQMLTDAVERVGLPVLGVLHRYQAAAVPSRHLGLVPATEQGAQAHRSVRALAELVSSACDLDAVSRLAAAAPPLGTRAWDPRPKRPAIWSPARVGVAGGRAFTFIYEENLELMRARDIELCPFDPTSDEALPEGLDALYLCGGFPEVYAQELEANAAMRSAIARFAAGGRPVVAECGGLLYLCRNLDGRNMCGVVDAEARMDARLTIGYRSAVAAPGSFLSAAGARVRGHEFHRSVVVPPAGANPAWIMAGRPEGFVHNGVHASYLHVHWAGYPQLADRFAAAVQQGRATLSLGPREGR
jgi:cobyrinic acid a,c-diamide synthase